MVAGAVTVPPLDHSGSAPTAWQCNLNGLETRVQTARNQMLTLKCHNRLSNVAFNLNQRPSVKVMQVMEWELDLEAGFVRPAGRKSGAGGAVKAVKGGKSRGAGGNGTLRLLVEAAMLRPRRVALRIPHGGWGRGERGGDGGGGGGDRTDPKKRNKRKSTSVGGGGGGGGERDGWSGTAASPSAHHWIEVQPWESVHHSIARRGAALATAAAGREAGGSLRPSTRPTLIHSSSFPYTPRSCMSVHTRGLHSFTLELNFSTFGTQSWVKLGYVAHKAQVELRSGRV